MATCVSPSLSCSWSHLVAHRCLLHGMSRTPVSVQWWGVLVSSIFVSIVSEVGGPTCFADALVCPAMGGVPDGRFQLSFTPAWYCMWRSACGFLVLLSWGSRFASCQSLTMVFFLGQASCRSSASSVPGRWPVGTGLSSMARPGRTPSNCSSCCLLGGLGSAGYSMGYGCFLGVFTMLVCGSFLR